MLLRVLGWIDGGGIAIYPSRFDARLNSVLGIRNHMELGPLLIVAFLAFLGWRFLTRDSSAEAAHSARRRGGKSSGGIPNTKPFHWDGKGDFDFEVVGESNYQSALARLAGEHGTTSVDKQFRATLALENSNRHDAKAVAVQIEGTTVAYLARAEARSYRRRLGQKGLSDVDATCDALVVGGGTRKNGEKLFYGVKLDIKPFE